MKCDDQTPACGNCSRLSLTCLFEDPETKKRRPRNYLETLEARVAFLEGRSQGSTAAASPSSLRTPEVQQGSSRHGTFVSDEGDRTTDLSLQTGLLDVRSAQPEPQYLGPSSTLSFSHILNSSLSRHLPERSKPAHSLLSRGAFSPSMPFLLDNDLALSLSNAYFANIQPQYPFLHEPTFRLWEKRLSTQSQEVTDLTLDSVPLFFVNMVYSVGALLLPNHQSLAEITGLALRQCIELGYHRKGKGFGPIEDDLHLQIRRRTFWCAYGIECTLSLWLGRPLSLPLHNISAEFPRDIDDSPIADSLQGTPRSTNTPKANMSNAIHVFQLRCLWARIYHFLYSEDVPIRANDGTYRSQIEELRVDLDKWLASAPQVVPRTGQTLSILQREHGTPIKHTWQTLRCIFFAALVYLHCLWTAPGVCETIQYDDVSRTCTDATMVLVVIAQAWEEAAPYRDLFEMLANRTMTIIVSRNNGAHAVPTPWASTDSTEQETWTQWMADIANTGMSDEMEGLLSGFMDEFMAYDMPD
ncbi:uncharacterized protein TRUGW13939_01382 [Talaromyces rugulosus]|uniref:Xylanolytic transcriptional activator regulatory domain-containing protein n=1 Tax=Talaromyces rugulosus TaxID=121627 RepID=A0A7H8QK37_TALRU|nr:uncharacterized protein TRUGW13939_01382 [Talaromyces rugulosus]QKX54297.1 hypothetical protein TRUGW13939_01382 [Talaromyces rugulosus]